MKWAPLLCAAEDWRAKNPVESKIDKFKERYNEERSDGNAS